MTLLVNGVSLARGPFRYDGGGGALVMLRSGWNQSGSASNFYAGSGTVIAGNSIADTAAFPNGGEPPNSWVIAPKGGGLSAYNAIASENALTVNVSNGINLAATVTSDGSLITPNLTLLVSIAATLLANATLTVTLQAPANLAATLASQGQLVAAMQATAALVATLTNPQATTAGLTLGATLNATIVNPQTTAAGLSLFSNFTAALSSPNELTGTLQSVASLSSALASNGQLVAGMGGLAILGAAMQNPGGVEGSTLRATGHFSAVMTTEGSVVTASACAAAVWNALVAQFQAAGSFGEAISQGAAGLTQQQIRDAMALATAEIAAAGSVDAGLAAIKAKTDLLASSAAGTINANVKAVNDVVIDGVGSDGDPWGPA